MAEWASDFSATIQRMHNLDNKDLDVAFSGHEKLRILAIADAPEVLEKITIALESDFFCQCCSTAQEAFEAVRSSPPALILCDLHLRGESGQEIFEQVKGRPGMEDVPVMFLSGSQLPDVVRRSPAAGMGVYCLRKPFSPQVLLELVDQALGAASR
jgi:CheY-like chemotaxis protein